MDENKNTEEFLDMYNEAKELVSSLKN